MSKDQNPVPLEYKEPVRLSPSDFEFVKKIDEGESGEVFLSKNKETNAFCIVKKINKKKTIDKRHVDHIHNELHILSSISHPLLLDTHGFFQDSRYLSIVTEFIPGGQVYSRLNNLKRLPVSHSQFYSANVILCFEYLHSHSIIYRDLKPENLLITADGYLKLVDFGFAKVVKGRTFTFCGTPEYVSPEIILNKGQGKGVDWWTLGILMFEFLTGVTPFKDKENSPFEIYQKVIKGEFRFPRKFNRDARSIIKHLLRKDLSKRYGNLKRGGFIRGL